MEVTINEAIHTAVKKLVDSGITTARLDAELLLSHILKKNRAWIFTHMHDGFDREYSKLFQELIGRRAQREPLQYILGRQEFWGLDFTVTRDVLIPRPETELVVEAAIDSLKGKSGPAIIDLCTGTGCIAISLANEYKSARVFATDKSALALRIARENARMHEASERLRLLEGDLFQPLEELDLRSRVDVITANPPYIPSKDLPSLQSEVKDYEPEMALIAGPEGTEIHQRIIREAPLFLKPGGALIMEMGIGQAGRLVAMAEETGAYTKPEILKDLAGIDRVIKIKKK
jgi:release factor glutamine methyltransferase